jgi:curli production assembly/transport component CsgG
MPEVSGSKLRLCLCAAALASLAAVSGCTTNNVLTQPPKLAVVTPVNSALRDLPPPRQRITVAVYDFGDLTGQFKDTDTVQTLSKAVTQGGAALLIKALEDAGNRRWFSVLERNQLNDLLKERQIITEMRRIYRNEKHIDASVLPPLMHAGIILEGGITGFDTNTMTGGLGAQYLGIGGDTKYIKNTVTVTLRAVSTKTGEVLASVNVRKEIVSVELEGNVFRYLELDKLLEAEAGVTYNEPKQIAVESAIDKAVLALVVRGAQVGIWQFANKQAGQHYIDAYLHEQFQNHVTLAEATPPPPATRHAQMSPYTRPRPGAFAAITNGGSGKGEVAPRKAPSGGNGIPQDYREQHMLPPPEQPNEKPAG